MAAEVTLGRKISEAEANSGPRSVKTAIAAFMGDSGEFQGTGQHRYNATKWLERFAKRTALFFRNAVGIDLANASKYSRQNSTR